MSEITVPADILELAKNDPDLIKLINEVVEGYAVNQILHYKPYDWQREFHANGKDCPERMLMAANRVGKTFSAACEISYHLTGDYPDWWEGRRFDRPVLVWTGSPTAETSRDIIQTTLLGGMGEKLGTGTVPKGKIVGSPKTRQSGVKNVIESFDVRHKSGGLSTCTLKMYEQGWQKFQGTAPHCIAEGQRIILADGRYIPIEDVKIGDRVLTVNATGKRVARKVTAVFDNGVRDVVEVRTRRGPWIKVTPDHKVFDSSTHKIRADEAEKIFQIPSDWQPDEPLESLPDAYYIWLGLVISEGSFNQRKITNGSVDLIDKAKSHLPAEAKLRKKEFPNHNHVPDWYLDWPDFWALVYSGLAHEKRVPDWVFMSANDKIAKFLSFLFAGGDGWANGHTVGYATTSKLLAEQVIILLWRMGVRSSMVYRESSVDTWRNQWWVHISSADAVVRFSEVIGIPSKEKALSKVTDECQRRFHVKKTRGSRDWIKKSPSSEAKKEKLRLASQRQRERYSSVNDVIPAGKSRTFDITVEHDHRFVAGLSVVSNCVWLDEEPDDYMIFSECQTRILTSHGIILVTFTPLLGMTELVQHFQDGGKGIYIKNATWNDAKHLGKEDKERLASSFRPHERDARTKGIPMLGEGAVFPVSEEDITTDPFKIPSHFARIKGCDFGMDHPAAGAELAWDRDQDIIYVIDSYKKAGEKAPYHAAWFNKGIDASIIPVAWPHDGMNREKVGGVRLAEAYRTHHVRMLGKSARYPKAPGETVEKGGSQPVEPIIDEVLERMLTGRLKVFSTQKQLLEEIRNYHRKNGVLAKLRDDILKAMFYAIMMKRYAVSLSVARAARGSGAPSTPIASMRQ